jgi:hypothetical protein
VSETQEFRQSYVWVASEKVDLETITETIRSYRGDSIHSEKWIDEEDCKNSDYFSISKQTQSRAAMYSTLCRVKADTTELCKSLRPQIGAAIFYKIDFDVVLALGLTELKAHISWQENVSSRTNGMNFDRSYHR